MLAEIPLDDDEQAAVNDDREALATLNRLTDTPTPAGPTPRRSAAHPPPPFCRSSASDMENRSET